MTFLNARRVIAAGALVLALSPILSGCMGAEKQTVTPNAQPTAVPGGGSEAEYRQRMQQNAQSGGR